jgi:hypothetical protein
VNSITITNHQQSHCALIYVHSHAHVVEKRTWHRHTFFCQRACSTCYTSNLSVIYDWFQSLISKFHVGTVLGRKKHDWPCEITCAFAACVGCCSHYIGMGLINSHGIIVQHEWDDHYQSLTKWSHIVLCSLTATCCGKAHVTSNIYKVLTLLFAMLEIGFRCGLWLVSLVNIEIQRRNQTWLMKTWFHYVEITCAFSPHVCWGMKNFLFVLWIYERNIVCTNQVMT